MKARDLMSSPVISVGPETTIGEVARTMLDRNVSCVPVLKDGKLVGVISHFDYNLHRKSFHMADHLYTFFGEWANVSDIEGLAHRMSHRKVGEVMHKEPATIQEDAPAIEVAEEMVNRRVNQLPVMRGKELVGIISRHDLLKMMVAPLPEGG